MSSSLWSHEWQHARLPHPSPSPGLCSNSCPLSLWCHPTISSSVAPFSSCSDSFPVSGSISVSQLFATGGQSIGASVPIFSNSGFISFRIDCFDLLAVQGTLKSLCKHHSSKASVHDAHPSLWYNSHPYMTTRRAIVLTRWTFVQERKICHCFYFCLQSFPASVFTNESALHIRWPKYWSFSFSNRPFKEYSGLIS